VQLVDISEGIRSSAYLSVADLAKAVKGSGAAFKVGPVDENCYCLVGILLREELERYLRSLLPPFLRIMMISSPKYRMFVNQRWGYPQTEELIKETY
jgi:hypothetical protein